MGIKNIVENFNINGNFIAYKPYGNGHINDTFALTFNKDGVLTRYILQKINENVFNDVEKLMQNIVNICDYLTTQAINNGEDPSKKTLTIIKTKLGKNFYTHTDTTKWRVMLLIENTEAYQIAVDPAIFEATGKAFGEFTSSLKDFPISTLNVVIPNFHNTPSRFLHFRHAVKINCCKRRRYCRDEINFALSLENKCTKIINLLASGELPIRVTHNDTKINNLLMDETTGKAVCVIDLDTIMPGSIVYDFGDGIRSGCNSSMEDDKHLENVHFNMEMFEFFTKGFIEGCIDTLTELEKDHLAYGSILITFECGVRFLTDYLDGDTYFKTHYSQHNLVRARTQFKLVKEMSDQLTEMENIVNKHYKNAKINYENSLIK